MQKLSRNLFASKTIHIHDSSTVVGGSLADAINQARINREYNI
jgi:hypothetical protein